MTLKKEVQETKSADDIYALAEVMDESIVLRYLYQGKEFSMEIPITSLNNHIQTGDKLNISLLVSVTGLTR